MLEEFLQNEPELVNLNLLANIHLCLCTAYYNSDSYEKSINHIKKAIFFFDYIGDKNKANRCYFNYINALRYSKKYDEAIKILNDFKCKHYNEFDSPSKILFYIQHAILLFNMGQYNRTLDVLSQININKLDSYNLNCYYFLKGHIEFLQHNHKQSLQHLKKCQKYFLNSPYIYDLDIILKDLYTITKNEKFNVSAKNIINCQNQYRKNIIIP